MNGLAKSLASARGRWHTSYGSEYRPPANRMEVIVRKPSRDTLEYKLWHLLREGDAYFLYVNCEQSAAGLTIMVRLTPDEYAEYHALGWTFLQYFAEKINYWPARYATRRVSATLQADADAAIRRSL